MTRRAACWVLIVMLFMILAAAGVFPWFRSRSQNRVVMSMQPQPWPEVPSETAWVARKSFPKGALAIRARDELGAWCEDGSFAAAYGARGKPGISPAQLAMVTVLRFTGNMTGRQVADAAPVSTGRR